MTLTPQHIAIIMDGNGRWATAKGLPRTEGHRQGAQTVTRILEAAHKRGIRYVTLYAFSTENWKRPADEVNTLMDLFRQYLKKDLSELEKQSVRIHFIGDRTRFPQDIQTRMNKLEQSTRLHDQYHLILALSYSGRDELTRAVKRLAEQVKAGQFNPADVTAEVIEAALDTAGIPDPDLMIRTSGEQRISNFLLWQLAYTEMYFTPVYWPDFTEEELDKAIEAFRTRDRRFGKVK